MNILIVEDEIRLAHALAQILKEEKYSVEMVHNGLDGLDYALSGQYDVIVLDVMLPELTGHEIVKKLRELNITTPVIMLTARDEIYDKVKGLDSGADDYMTKPFSPEELLARIRAISRRQGEVLIDEAKFADLILNLSTNILSCKHKSIQLSFKEAEILKILMLNSKIITSKEDLIVKVWGIDSEAEDNNVEAYISFIRKKLFFLESKVSVKTTRKVGYQLGE